MIQYKSTIRISPPKHRPSGLLRWLPLFAVVLFACKKPTSVSSDAGADSGDAGNITDAGDSSVDAGATDGGWGPDAPVCDPITTWCTVRDRLPNWPGLSTGFGYMQSTGFACYQNRGADANSIEVAVGPGGVYVLSGSYQGIPEGLDMHAPGYTLLLNDGTGWQTLGAQHELAGGTIARNLTVTPDGTVYATFLGGSLNCGIRRLYPGTPTCVATSTSSLDSSPLPRAIETAGARVFGLEDTRVAELADGGLSTLINFPAVTGTPRAFWTDGTDMVVTGSDALLLRRSGGTTAQVANTPADTYDTLAAVSADDFRVAGSTVQKYVTGSLQPAALPPTLCGASERVLRWEFAGSTLYYLTETQFGKIDGTGAYAPIFNIPCASGYTFEDFDARDSDGSVFLAIFDGYEATTTCGATHVVWYDGVKLQEF